MTDLIPPPDAPPGEAPSRPAVQSMPHSPDAEIVTLGSMMLDSRTIPQVTRHIGPADMYVADHAAIFAAIVAVYDRGQKPDQIAVTDELERTGQLATIHTGALAVHDIVAQVPSPASAVYYARIVARHAARRRLIDTCNAAMLAAYQPDCDPTTLASTVGEELIYDLAASAEDDWPVYADGEIDQLPATDWIIDQLLPDGVTFLYGASTAGKTFVAVDWSLCLAHGVRWAGRKVSSRRVVYVAAEGAGGIARRRRAWLSVNQPPDATGGFLLLPRRINLRDRGDQSRLTRIVETHRAGLLVLDTLSMTVIGNENDGGEMGEYLSACQRIHQRTGASVLIVHHQGKDADRGMRGSSKFFNDADGVIQVARPEVSSPRSIRLSRVKAKEAEEVPDVWLRLQPHPPSAVLTVIQKPPVRSGVLPP